MYCSTSLTANKNLEVKTCIAEEGECDDVITLATLHCLFWIPEPERSFKILRTPRDTTIAFFEQF